MAAKTVISLCPEKLNFSDKTSLRPEQINSLNSSAQLLWIQVLSMSQYHKRTLQVTTLSMVIQLRRSVSGWWVLTILTQSRQSVQWLSTHSAQWLWVEFKKVFLHLLLRQS
jgi:hypothetical protein